MNSKSLKSILLIAGTKSHGPEGNGIHDYPATVKLLKELLEKSNVANQVSVSCCLDGWPADPALVEQADTLVVYSDGRDGFRHPQGNESLHLATAQRIHQVDRRMKQGCGIAVIHFSVFAGHHHERYVNDWYGGYFDWGTDAREGWYSDMKIIEADVVPASVDHPILHGVKPFRMTEEFYYNLRFDRSDKALTPIWKAPALNGREPDGNLVAWARQRTDGGRGFGTSCGHFLDNFRLPDYRMMLLNAIVWTAGIAPPAGGVR